MKIGFKLWLVFGIISILIAVQVLITNNLIKVIEENTKDVVTDQLPQIELTQGIIGNVNLQARSIRNIMLAQVISDNDVINQEKQRLEKSHASVDSLKEILTSLLTTPKSIGMLNRIKDADKAYREAFQKSYDFYKAGDLKGSILFLFNEIRNKQTEFLDATNVLNDRFNNSAKKESQAAYDAAEETLNMSLIIGIIIIVISLGSAYIVIRSITRPINECVDAANKLSDGNTNVIFKTNSKGETGKLVEAMSKMAANISSMVSDANKLGEATVAGKLDVRADATNYKGDYNKLISGFNNTLDSIIKPLNLAAEYVDRISSGDIPPKITDDYKGDFNEIKNNLNQCIDSLDGLIKEMIDTTKLQREGDIEAFANVDKFKGIYKNLISGYNEAMEIHINNILGILDLMNDYSAGDLSKEMPVLPGKQIIATERVNKLRQNVLNLITDANLLSKAAVEGKLDVRADSSKHQGDFRKIVDGINNTLDAIIHPLNMAAEYVDRISKGDLPPKIIDEYKGDFNEIKNNLNQCVDAITFMVNDVLMLSQSSIAGKFEVRADVVKHNGNFRKIIEGINGTLDTIIDKIFWYEQLLDSIPWPLSVTDLDMNWTFINKATEGVINKKRKDVVGMQCNNWGADICNTEKCGVAGLRKGKATSFFTQPGLNMDFKVDTHYITNAKGEKTGHIEIVSDVTKESRIAKFTATEIDRLAKNLQLIANGDLNVDLNIFPADEYTKNEFENFSKIFDNLKLAVEAIRLLADDASMLAKAAEDGELEKRADVNKHRGDFRKVIEGINSTLAFIVKPVVETIQVMQSMADGDLTKRIENEYKGDSLALKNAVNESIESMHEILLQVRTTVEEVNRGALQVSDASTALSQGATEQAASLEEITSSMTEIGSQTKLNAENSNQANKLTLDARQSAEKGNTEMNQLNNAMLEINESSKNISKIIKVIDEIAFQTNLLALNAAVEAARAGRHGKGFAVVAEEVRNLAARSATAAKETSEMIENSIKTVEKGAGLATKTSDALEEIKNNSIKAADIVGEITTLSNEQAQGIAQINEGLTQIDRVTQTNTASAEESASAAEQLSGQAGQLMQMISRFKLKSGMKSDYSSDFDSKSYSTSKMIKGNTFKSNLLTESKGRERMKPEEIISLDESNFGKY
ncbi:MAG TPA: methyl-accepting chemotaxis protein [Candidatus Kapabacteria bacterium]|nr:methyl-accepting chemotaxis protein [Candidatus Kapabacteria bacterium]HPO63548.1 methyl-accepting chemotaxis protein [Candidatus Kapabacteria bacterium]